MQNIHNEIEKRLKSGPKRDSFSTLMFVLMTEFHQPFSEIMELPIPLVNELMRLREKKAKDEEKQWRRQKTQ